MLLCFSHVNILSILTCALTAPLLTSPAAIFLPLLHYHPLSLGFSSSPSPIPVIYTFVVWGMAWDDASHRTVSVNVFVGSWDCASAALFLSSITLQNLVIFWDTLLPIFI